MDNQTLKSQFFRSISVHLRKLQVAAPFFRSIPVHFKRKFSIIPEYIRSTVHRIVRVYLQKTEQTVTAKTAMLLQF